MALAGIQAVVVNGALALRLVSASDTNVRASIVSLFRESLTLEAIIVRNLLHYSGLVAAGLTV